LDYELLDAVAVNITAVLHKVARGADTAVAVVTHPVITQDLAATVAAITQNQHRMVVTLTTPDWIDNDEYFLCEFSFEVGGVCVIDILGAFVNFTFRA
jgi:broad specificity phosphatase PhoE